MLSLKNISKTFGDKKILSSVSFSIGKEIVALIGNNGSGKSTLFKIIKGEIAPDSGEVASDEVIGYLPQKIEFGEQSVSEFLNFEEVDYKIQSIFNKLGISSINKEQRIADLSGGEKTKISLARILLSDPSPTLLLLDEPTNNMDLDGIFFIEEFISKFEGSVFIASHDRALLDEIADRVIELSGGEIKQYGGNYSFFKQQKEIEKEAYARKFLVQEKRIEKIKDDINTIRSRTLHGEEKFSSGDPYQRRKIRKAAQQGAARKKKLEKFLQSDEKLEKPLSRINYPFRFEGNIHSDKFILGLKNVNKSFSGRKILDNVSLSLTGKHHFWVSGSNGSGKSTLLKLLCFSLAPDSGEIEIGSNIKVGYFSQEIISDNKRSTPLDELLLLGAVKTDIFKYLKFLNLEESDAEKPLSALSRGQLTKVEFIKLLIGNNDILILDEPTNHLEMDTREQLENALSLYEGALLIASHDQYFLEQIGIDREIELKDGKLYEK